MTETGSAWQDERVRSVRELPVRTRYPRTVGRNAKLGGHGPGPDARLLVIEAGGAVGQGLLEGERRPLPDLVGRPLGEFFDAGTGVTDPALAAMDAALHDLVARLLEVPVYRLLGAVGDRTVSCYSGAIYLDDLDPDDAPRGVAAVLAECAADHAAGFRDFKLKIGRGYRWMEAEAGLRRDIEVTRAVRAAYPEARLLVDANNGYDVAGFLRYLEQVTDCDLFWVEEPFQEDEHDLLRLRTFLREHMPGTRIADGEHDPDEEHVLRLAELGLLDVLLMDVLSYGITAWRRLMPTLRRLGVEASPHAWGHPVKTLYTAQLAAGLGNVVTVEGVPGETGLPGDTGASGDTDGVGTASYGLAEGTLIVSDRPGFGVTIG